MNILFFIASMLFCYNAFAATSVTQYGITWTFAEDYTVGQFVNGDYWVLDPGYGVAITSITNTRHSGLDLSTVDYDGTQIDSYRGINTYNGLDSRTSGYLQSYNINHSMPYTVFGNKSIMSAISWLSGDTDKPTNWTGRPWLKRTAILTCVTSIPANGSFRPSYAANRKTTYSALTGTTPSLAPPAGIRPLSEYSAWVTGPWTDLTDSYGSEYLRPSDNYPYMGAYKDGTYNRYVSSAYGAAILAATLDPGVVGDKTQLINSLIQIGIDYYGLYQNGAVWKADGGHRQGYKLPILFAGKMLGNDGMLSVGSAPLNTFQEDNHWYITAADIEAAHCGDYNGCPIPCGDSGLKITDVTAKQYTINDIGKPEWGIKHLVLPCSDDATLTARYRAINGLSLSAHTLAAHILGLKTAWNQPSFFDYHDRWMNDIKGGADIYITGAMWDAYRSSYPPVWSGSPTPPTPPTPTAATFLPFKTNGKATRAPQ